MAQSLLRDRSPGGARFVVACRATPVPTDVPSDQFIPRDSVVPSVVNEYFHYRKLAIVARNPEILWSHYPELRAGEDLSKGINTEGWLASRAVVSRALADIMYDLDRYERMRIISSSADSTVVRVHGLEQYIQTDFSNGTAGEFIIDLHLQRSGDRWTVVLTDETTLAEFHSAR